MPTFDALVLFVSMPSEISILSYSSIFILHINNRLRKVEDNIYHLFCDRSYYYSYFKEINNFV